MKDVITDILTSSRPASPSDQIHKDIDRDFYLGAARRQGVRVIDDVLTPKPQQGEWTRISQGRASSEERLGSGAIVAKLGRADLSATSVALGVTPTDDWRAFAAADELAVPRGRV